MAPERQTQTTGGRSLSTCARTQSELDTKAAMSCSGSKGPMFLASSVRKEVSGRFVDRVNGTRVASKEQVTVAIEVRRKMGLNARGILETRESPDGYRIRQLAAWRNHNPSRRSPAVWFFWVCIARNSEPSRSTSPRCFSASHLAARARIPPERKRPEGSAQNQEHSCDCYGRGYAIEANRTQQGLEQAYWQRLQRER
jgi:NADH:ubiquinone oxidoreductase subunit